MAERRRHKRHAKRLKVRYGEASFEKTAFTADISVGGLFIVGNAPPLDARIHLELVTDTRPLYFEGVVQRLVVTPPELRQVSRGGFGVRLLSPAELLPEILPHLRNKAAVTVVYNSKDELKKAYESELKRGGIYVRTESKFAINTVIPVDLELAYSGQTVSVHTRVVHLVPEESGKNGVALVFVDPSVALADLSALVT